MLAVRTNASQLCAAPRLAPARAARSVTVRNESGFNAQIQKLRAESPVPIEYPYAGIVWGVTLLTWGSPLDFLGKAVILLHFLAAATNVARLGAIARPDQATGETAAAKALGTGLLFGPFAVTDAKAKE